MKLEIDRYLAGPEQRNFASLELVNLVVSSCYKKGNTHIMKNQLLLVLALIPGPTGVLFAQTNQPLSLPDAISLAEINNPAQRQIENNRWGASWAVRNSYGAFLPSVNASGTLSYSGLGAQRFLTSEFSQPSATIGSNYGLNLSWTLSGTTLMQPATERARAHATEASINSARINLKSQVTQQYLNILQALEEVQLADAQLTRNDESLRLAQARHNVGQVTLLDVRQAEVLWGQAQVGALQERQDVTVEKLRLFQMMGIPAPEDLQQVVLSDTFAVTQPTWELDDLLESAQMDNADLNSLRSQEDATRWGARSSRSRWFPSIQVNARWSGFTQSFTNGDFLVDQARASSLANIAACEQDNTIVTVVNQSGAGLATADCTAFAILPADEQLILDGNDAFPFRFTTQPFSASVTVSIPIFTNFSRSLAISQSSMALDDAREAVRARELQVRTDVSQAFYNLRTSFETIAIQDRNRSAAADQLRLATQRYRLGSGTFIELLDAQVAAQQAASDYINATYSFHRSVAVLESAVGRELR